MNTDTPSITWTKLRNGSWGLRGPAELLRPAATVTVVRRSGESTRVQVARVLWTGGGVAIAAVSPRRSSSSYIPFPRRGGGGCHTDGNCSSMCDASCPCSDGSWYRCS